MAERYATRAAVAANASAGIEAAAAVHADPDYQIEVTGLTLWTTVVKLHSDVQVGILKRLEIDNAEYWLNRVIVRSYTIASGVMDHAILNAFGGQLPKRIWFYLVTNTAFQGAYNENPFNAAHHNVNYVCVHVNGTPYPNIPFTPDYQRNGNWTREYYSLFDASGIKYGNQGLDITREDYPNGYCIYGLDLTSNHGAGDASHMNLVKQGEVRIEFKFRTAPQHALSCVVYAEFDNLMEIDTNRNVIANWAGGSS